MSSQTWLIYGAYGYTGQLVAEEAVRRGHTPVLGGRSAARLAALAQRLGLDWVSFDLVDEARLNNIVSDFSLVFHAAGPFMQTSAPMVQACLQRGVNYVDIAGEVKVFESLLALDRQAREKGIVIIPGVGFNVLASDCLARCVTERFAHPIHLDIATAWITNSMSPGSFKTMIDSFPLGALARRQGRLVRTSVRKGRRRIRFMDRERSVLPTSLGDLTAAYRTTGIPNITTYTAVSEESAGFYSWAEPVYRNLFALAPFRRLAKEWIGRTRGGFDERANHTERAQVWVSVRNEAGDERQAWLETVNSYQFTAVAGVRSVEKVLDEQPLGATTPALAFGADFVLEIPGTRRTDRLADSQSN